MDDGMMWNLTGTANQQAIARAAFQRIKFPLDWLRLPGQPELGWRDLNDGGYFVQERRHDDHSHAPGHGHGDRPEPLVGKFNGRKWIMGVFYPVSARVYVDTRLEDYPELAAAVICAEVAHAVDEFLPLTDAQRNTIIGLACLHTPGTHGWWERHDYGAEYWALVGELFMVLFTRAYSDIPFGDTSDFEHDPNLVTPEKLREIVGIMRTDHAPVIPPAPAVEPHDHDHAPEAVPEPTPEATPEPTPEPTPEAVPEPAPVAPAPDPSEFKHFPGGKDIYHRRGHYGLSRGVPLQTFEGFEPCKVCINRKRRK